MTPLTEHREKKFRNAIQHKQPNITVIFDNVVDPHNIYACMRTADSIGLIEMYSINTGKRFQRKLKEGKRSGASAKKWIQLHEFDSYEACFEVVKRKYQKVLGTFLGENSADLYSLDLTESVALVFGNEQFGISEEAKKFCDGNFVIPQKGMIESLNISVACAVTLYEAYRQRASAGMYGEKSLMTAAEKEQMYEAWIAKKEEIREEKKNRYHPTQSQ
jgi:tRNA (guanosine-2'-O-)-methyltransferase